MTHPAVIWIGAIVSLGVFSYLIKDNLYYRVVQQTALGVMVGMGIMLTIQNVLWPNWLQPIVHASKSYALSHKELLWLLAIIPGSLWYFQLSKKRFGASTIITGLFIGVAAGTAFKVWLLLIMPQIGASLKPLNPFRVYWTECLNNLVFVIAILTTLLYFFFSFKGESPFAQKSMRAGRLMIMVALGSMFGATVMTRLAYLLERLRFLFADWFMGQIIHGILGL
jgi:hypothetical protein